MNRNADLELARALERTEGSACAAMVRARAKRRGVAAAVLDFGGTQAMQDGEGSPMTQAFGHGLFDDPNGHELDAIEAFYRSHSTHPVLEVAPLAGVATLTRLQQHGYRIIELSNVLYRESAGGVATPPRQAAGLSVRGIDVTEANRFAETAAAGWSGGSAEIADFIHELSLAVVPAQGMVSFLAEIDGQAVASASLFLAEGVALLAGASTVPAARNQGAQTALLAARLAYAAEHACPLAMMACEPGSASQRNGERQGFRIAYTRMKWRQD